MKMHEMQLPTYESLMGLPTVGKDQIINIPLTEIHSYEKGNKFHDLEGDDLSDAMDSIERNGVIQPIIVRKSESGGYEIISGHQRKRVCELLNMVTIPAICRNYDDDTADDIMIDANIGRSKQYASELAYISRKKLDTMGHQGKSSRVGEVAENVGRRTGKSARTIYRYAKLTELMPELIEKVDSKRLGVSSGIEVSHLSLKEQSWLLNFIDDYSVKVSIQQAKELRRLSENGALSESKMQEILFAVPVSKKNKSVSFGNEIRRFFPADCDEEVIKNTVYQLLEAWTKESKE